MKREIPYYRYAIKFNEYAIFFDSRLVERKKSDSIVECLNRLRKHFEKSNQLTFNSIRFIYKAYNRECIDVTFFRSEEVRKNILDKIGIELWDPTDVFKLFDDIGSFCSNILVEEMRRKRERKAYKNG